MKVLYSKKNGTINKLSGVNLPVDADKIDYDNTESELQSTNVQDAIDEVNDIVADKVDKVAGKSLSTNDYTNEDKAKLDIDTHTVEGNPLSFTTDSAQVAKDAVITLEPIQAGSGDPSPSNVRAISGLSEIGILSCGKNLCDNNKVVKGYYGDNGIWIQDNDFASSDFIVVKPNTSYSTTLFDNNGNSIDTLVVTFWSASKGFQRQLITSPFQTDSDTKYVVVRTYQSDSGYVTTNNFKFQLEEGSTATTYESYKSSTDLTIQLGQTVYGGTLDFKNGVLTVDKGYADMNSNWTLFTDYIYKVNVSTESRQFLISNIYKRDDKLTSDGVSTFYEWFGGSPAIFIKDSNYQNDLASWKTARNDLQVVYQLAEPFTIQLTPHEISLLQGINNVSTTADSIKLTYSDGVLATLEDVKQVGESVENTFDIINDIKYINCNDCSTIESIFDTIKQGQWKPLKNNIYGTGLIGHLESTNLRTLLGNPNINNYVKVYIKPIVSAVNECHLAEVFAVSDVSEQSVIKRKYIWINKYTASQSAWETINYT